MKLTIQQTVLLLISLSVLACSDNVVQKEKVVQKNNKKEHAKEQKVSIEQVKTAEVEINAENKIKKLKQSLPLSKKLNNQKYSITINKEKFQTTIKPLIAGAKVFNVQMGESGRVVGDFVVVSNQILVANDFGHISHFTKIAKNTYKISPKKSFGLMSFYQDLLKDNRFTTVEMAIDYSREKQLKSY